MDGWSVGRSVDGFLFRTEIMSQPKRHYLAPEEAAARVQSLLKAFDKPPDGKIKITGVGAGAWGTVFVAVSAVWGNQLILKHFWGFGLNISDYQRTLLVPTQR